MFCDTLFPTTIAFISAAYFVVQRRRLLLRKKENEKHVWGVSAAFLRRFTIKNNLQTGSSTFIPVGSHPCPPHWWTDGAMTKTTGNITSLIIVPRTLSTKQNYVDLDGVRENKDTETQELDIGIATSFVSHAWGCSFSALVDTLVEHSHRAKQAALPTPYYWLDIFCKNQHVIQGDETAKELTRAVEETGSTLLMCDGKWFQPKCFTRVWCLYEIMWTLRLGSKLRVILPSENVLTTLSETSCETSLSQSQEMSQETRLDFSVLRSISDIDVLNAEASVASDKQMIFDWIRHQLDVSPCLMKLVLSCVMPWRNHC